MGWLIAIAAAALVGGVVKGISDHNYQQEQLEIQRKNQIEGYKTAFNNALSSFDDIVGKFNRLMIEGVNEVEETISGYRTQIDNFDLMKTEATDDILAEINTVDDLLEGWQGSYDAQTRSAKSEGRNTLTSLLSNWSDAEVAAADRGMGGSMQLIAQQEKAKAIEYAGSDLSLAGNDGIFGASYETMLSNLNSQKSQYELKRSILGTDLQVTNMNLDNQLESWKRSLASSTQALEANRQTLKDQIDNLERQYGIAQENATKIGVTDPKLVDMRSTIDRLKSQL